MLKTVIQQGRRREITGGVPSGYVEDYFDPRTTLGAVFSILLRFGAAEACITILSFRRQLEAPKGEKIFRQVGPRSTA